MFSELEDDVKKMKCLQYVLLLLPEQNRMFLQVQTYFLLKNPLPFSALKTPSALSAYQCSLEFN